MSAISTPFAQHWRAVRHKHFTTKLYPQRLSEDDIRLLTILPSHDANAPIICELSLYRVSVAPAYEGLSYVWGDPKAVATVICNGIEIEITISLHNALWKIRDSEEPRTIWADALCMNQTDVCEKNVHVPLMGRVFSRSTNTVIYLGEASQLEAAEAQAGLIAIWRFIEDWGHQTSVSVEDDEEFYYQSELLTTLLDKLHEDLPVVSWDAITKLFNAAWFSRTWCVQEIMLARDSPFDSYAIYGHIRIPYQYVARVALFLMLASEDGFGFARKLKLRECVGAMGVLSIADGESMDLFDILDLLSGHLATDPRDRIYGVLGILRQRFGYDPRGIDVDYTKSVVQVYIDTATEVIRSRGNLEILDSIEHPDGFEDDTEFPTWVTAWDEPRRFTLCTLPYADNFRTTFSAPKSEDSRVSVNWKVHGNQLLVSGLQYGCVAKILPLSEACLVTTFEKVRRQTQRIRTSCFDCKEELLTIARTFRTGRISSSVHFGEASDEQRATFLADLLAHMHQLLPYCCLNCPGVPEDDLYVIDDRGTKVEGRSERYTLLLERFYESRIFFETSLGDYGIGPEYLQLGDNIVGLMGGSSPYALRSKGNSYLALGCVYMDNLTDGSHFRKMLDYTEPEQFTLI